jgi:hypothetical protein
MTARTTGAGQTCHAIRGGRARAAHGGRPREPLSQQGLENTHLYPGRPSYCQEPLTHVAESNWTTLYG